MSIDKVTTSITGRTTPTPTPEPKNSHAILEHKGKVSSNTLLLLLKRSLSKKISVDTFQPAAARIFVRQSNPPRAASLLSTGSKPSLEEREKELNACMSEISVELSTEENTEVPSRLSAPPDPEEETSPTGTSVFHETVAPLGTTVIKDQAAATPDFSKLKLAEESPQDYVKRRAQEDLPPTPYDWDIQKAPENPNDLIAMITEKRADGKPGRRITPFAIYEEQNPLTLTGALPEGFAELARQASETALPRKSGKRTLPASVKDGSISPRKASTAAKRDTVPVSNAVPDAPPSYAEAMGIPKSPKRYTLKQLQSLQARLASTSGTDDAKSLLLLDPKNQDALLELTSNLAAKLRDAAPNSYLGKTLDILYAMIRELKGGKPEISRYAFNWLMARAKELLNYESVADLQAKDARARKPELNFAVVQGQQGGAEKRPRQLQETLAKKFAAANSKF